MDSSKNENRLVWLFLAAGVLTNILTGWSWGTFADSALLFWISAAMFFYWLAAAPIFATAFVVLTIKKRVSWVGLLLVVTGLAALWPRTLGVAVARFALEQIAARGRPIVQALAEYERDFGHEPESLNDLVPRYLPSVPTTGLKHSPTFDFSLEPVAGHRHTIQKRHLFIGRQCWVDRCYFMYSPASWGERFSHEQRVGEWVDWKT
jgi:hypothetical protein